MPRLLTTITEGLGNVINISFKPTADTTVHTKDAGYTAPVLNLQGGVYLVSRVTSGNGVGGTVSRSFVYWGARADTQGRGFLGFSAIEEIDEASGIWSRRWFSQTFPHTGLVIASSRQMNTGQFLSQANFELGCTDFVSGSSCTVAPGKRYFPHVSAAVETHNDLNGAFMTRMCTQNTFDVHGNATQVKVTDLSVGGTCPVLPSAPTGATAFSKNTINEFTNDTTNWFLGRLKKSTVTSTTP
jgi:hypothetical protein